MPNFQTCKIVASASVAMSEVDGGAALLDLESNTYFSLNRTGAVIWRAIETPALLDDVCAAVAERFVISSEKCRPDVAQLVEQLIGSRLARVVDAPAD